MSLFTRHAGFTVLELIVSITVIAVLVTLSLPMLSKARISADTTICLSNIRSVGVLLHQYCNDHQEIMPYAGDTLREVTIPGGLRVEVGDTWGFDHGFWTVLYPERWNKLVWERSLNCPKMPPFDPDAARGGPLQTLQSYAFPFYWMSSALWINATTLRELGAALGDLRPRANSIAQITFPSKKVLVYELAAPCGGPAALSMAGTIGQTFGVARGTIFADGSGRRVIIEREGLPTATGLYSFSHTLGGIYGRDVP